MPLKPPETELGRLFADVRAARQETLKRAAQKMGYSPWILRDACNLVSECTKSAPFWDVFADYLGIDVATAQALAAQPCQPAAPVAVPVPEQHKQSLHPLPTPRVTLAGIQYYPAGVVHHGGCQHCYAYAACREIVLWQDGLALCEQLLPIEMLPETAQAVIALNIYHERLQKPAPILEL